MKLLFTTFWNFDDAAVNGIAKKILGQKRAFEALGFQVDLCYAKGGRYIWEREGRQISLCKTKRYITRIVAAAALAKALQRENARYDCAYIRYALADMGLLSLVKALEKQNTRSVIEIPNYPYEMEFQNGLLRASLALDQIYRRPVAKRVGQYVIYTDYQSVYGVPAIVTANGLDTAAVPCSTSAPQTNGAIRLIAVAGFSPWHGYDRLLTGLAAYRKAGGKRAFTIELVGDGPALADYRSLAAEAGLSGSVTFSGFLGGEALNAAFERADIAVDSLGVYRIGMRYSTSLKYFEYLVRGLPTAALGRRVQEAPLAPYTLTVPNDASPVDFEELASFYDRVVSGGGETLHAAIRKAACPLCSMEETLRPVAAYLKGEERT